MAFTMPNFPILTRDQANPFKAALEEAFKGYGMGLQAKYAKPRMEQELQKALLENLWNPKKWQSEINLRGAQAGLAGSESDKIRFLMKNPQYISPEGMLISQAMGGGRGAQPGQGGQSNQDFGANNEAFSQEVEQIAQNGNGSAQGYSPTQADQQAMGNMQPGDSYVLGGQENAPRQGAQQPVGNNAYDPNALAFNPPPLQSPTGNPQMDNLWYKKFGMSPLNQAQLELAQKQAEKYQTATMERNNEFNTQATFANQSTVDAHKFLDALERSNGLQTGYFGSKTPAIKDAEQEMEAYGNGMASAATQLFKDGHAIHKSDIELQQMAKPNRTQNKDVSFDLAHGVIAKNDRLKERQQFYALGTQQRLKPEVLDAMWNKYETERPYIDPETKMPNDAYKGSWKDYMSPQSVNAFLNGQDYIPPGQQVLQGMNWTKQDLKDIKKWAEKNHFNPKEYDKKHLYEYAKEEGSLAQLKQGYMQRGAFKNG